MTTAARVLFTVAVLAVFVAAIVYTAICARAAVAAEAEATLDEHVGAELRSIAPPASDPIPAPADVATAA